MTEAISEDNFLARPRLVPIAGREAMAARIAQVACQLEKLIENPLVKETLNRLPDNGTAIPLGPGYCLTNEGLMWDNWHRPSWWQLSAAFCPCSTYPLPSSSPSLCPNTGRVKP